MLLTLAAYFSGLITFAVLDFIWFALMAGSFYRSELSSVLNSNIPISFTMIIFYLGYVLIIFYLVKNFFILQGLAGVLLNGALIGLLVYGTYNFVNMSVLNNWSYKVLVVDTLWGCFVTAILSLAIYLVLK